MTHRASSVIEVRSMKRLQGLVAFIVMMLLFVAMIDPYIRQAVIYLMIALVTVGMVWLMYQLVHFSSGHKSRLFDASRRRDDV